MFIEMNDVLPKNRGILKIKVTTGFLVVALIAVLLGLARLESETGTVADWVVESSVMVSLFITLLTYHFTIRFKSAKASSVLNGRRLIATNVIFTTCLLLLSTLKYLLQSHGENWMMCVLIVLLPLIIVFNFPTLNPLWKKILPGETLAGKDILDAMPELLAVLDEIFPGRGPASYRVIDYGNDVVFLGDDQDFYSRAGEDDYLSMNFATQWMTRKFEHVEKNNSTFLFSESSLSFHEALELAAAKEKAKTGKEISTLIKHKEIVRDVIERTMNRHV